MLNFNDLIYNKLLGLLSNQGKALKKRLREKRNLDADLYACFLTENFFASSAHEIDIVFGAVL
jgi:hypothetical protein